MLKKLSKSLVRTASKESNHSADAVLTFVDNTVKIGRATKQGKLHPNEDRCTVLESMTDLLDEEVFTFSEMLEFELQSSGNLLDKCVYLGVFDGHGGSGASSFVARQLHGKIAKNLEDVDSLLDLKAVQAVQRSFDQVERDFETYSQTPALVDNSGSCAAVAIICGTDVLVAHCGDCRVVIRSCGETICVTRDHRVDDPEETRRIKQLGGVVVDGRLSGILCPSRSFGDFDVKQTVPAQVLVATPDVARYSVDLGPLGKYNSFMVMASDGLWDVMEVEDVLSFVEKVLRKTGSADVAAQRLVETASRNNHDDVTVVIVVWQRVKDGQAGAAPRPGSKDDEDIVSPNPTRKKYTPDSKVVKQ